MSERQRHRMIWAQRLAALTLALSTMTAAGCDETLSKIAGPTPTLEPTFSSIRTNIIEAQDSAGRRACVQCHTNVGRNPAAGLNLVVDPYAAMVNVPSRNKPGAIIVVPGDPDGSYLYQKLIGAPGIVGLRMPLVPPHLTEGQLLIVRRWIQNGAKND